VFRGKEHAVCSSLRTGSNAVNAHPESTAKNYREL